MLKWIVCLALMLGSCIEGEEAEPPVIVEEDVEAPELNDVLMEIQENVLEVLMRLMGDRSMVNGFTQAVLLKHFLVTIEALSSLTVEWNDFLYDYISSENRQLFAAYRETYPNLNAELSALFDQIEDGFDIVDQTTGQQDVQDLQDEHDI